MIWNPVGSGVNGIIYHLRGTLDSANNGDHIHLHVIDSITSWTKAFNGHNKFIGAIAAKLEVYFRSSTTHIGSEHLAEEPRPLYESTEFLKGNSSIILPEGYGLAIIGGATNQDVSAWFEWIEQTA